MREPGLRSGGPSRSRKGWIFLLGFACWLVWISGAFGNSGVIQAYKLSQVRRDMSLRVKALENEKQRLTATLRGLENDAFMQELAIRESLGFVRAGELVFEFRDR